MSVTVKWEPTCDQNFKAQYSNAFTEWINNNSTQQVQAGGRNNWTSTNMVFDEALVLNGLHPTTSAWDQNSTPHVTVRLSTAQLRQENSWYTLHWRPNGESTILQQPDNASSREARRAIAKQKKLRRRERKKQEKKGKDDKDTGGQGGVSETTTPRLVA